jgi:hypothetical protein
VNTKGPSAGTRIIIASRLKELDRILIKKKSRCFASTMESIGSNDGRVFMASLETIRNAVLLLLRIKLWTEMNLLVSFISRLSTYIWYQICLQISTRLFPNEKLHVYWY